jgi:hypothetical protein
MNITPVSSYVSALAGTQPVQASPVNNASDPVGDGDGGGRAHRSHGGGGHMRQALTQALQSLGLNMPQGPSTATSTSQTAGPTDSDGDSDGSTSATGSVKQDMRQFMHALFQAVKGETTSGTSTTGTNSTDPKAGFSAGLSALISQVSSGSAPSDLQGAFTKLVSDLQQANPTSTSTGSATGTTGPTSTQATLQALLANLQQDLGYANSGTSAIGNSISTLA